MASLSDLGLMRTLLAGVGNTIGLCNERTLAEFGVECLRMASSERLQFLGRANMPLPRPPGSPLQAAAVPFVFKAAAVGGPRGGGRGGRKGQKWRKANFGKGKEQSASKPIPITEEEAAALSLLRILLLHFVAVGRAAEGLASMADVSFILERGQGLSGCPAILDHALKEQAIEEVLVDVLEKPEAWVRLLGESPDRDAVANAKVCSPFLIGISYCLLESVGVSLYEQFFRSTKELLSAFVFVSRYWFILLLIWISDVKTTKKQSLNTLAAEFLQMLPPSALNPKRFREE